MNTIMSDKWSYLHENIIFLFRLMQKCLSPVINCLFMLHELVFLGCYWQFTWYPYTFGSYSYSCKILQPYVADTVRMHSNVVLSSNGALLIKTVIENNRQWSTFASDRFGCWIHVNQPKHLTSERMRIRSFGGAMGVFTRSVKSISSGEILHKNCEPLYWSQTFC